MGRPKLNDYTFYKFVNINSEVKMYFVGSTANLKARIDYYKRNVNNPTNSVYNNNLNTTIRFYGGMNEFQVIPLGTSKQITLPESRIIEDTYRTKLKDQLDNHTSNSTYNQSINV